MLKQGVRVSVKWLQLTVGRLAFVADFETRNFNFKNKFDMENNTSINHENGNDANRFLPSIFSEDYLKWVKQANLPPLTNTQHKFAEWLLEEGNSKVIAQIGDLDSVFTSVRRWVKNGR
jgi:hypothetical protein